MSKASLERDIKALAERWQKESKDRPFSLNGYWTGTYDQKNTGSKILLEILENNK